MASLSGDVCGALPLLCEYMRSTGVARGVDVDELAVAYCTSPEEVPRSWRAELNAFVTLFTTASSAGALATFFAAQRDVES